MNKISNAKITYNILCGLVLLAILAFSAVTLLATVAHAQTNASYQPYAHPVIVKETSEPSTNPVPAIISISPSTANLGDGAKTVTVFGSGFIPGSVVRWNGSSRPTTFIDYSHLIVSLYASDMYGSSGRYINVYNGAPGGGYSNSAFFTIKGYVEPTTGATSVNTDGANNAGTIDGQTNMEESYGSLTSNAIFGSTSFMPSGLIQWILFGILILLIVILVRKIFGGEKKYYKAPLKHA